MNTQDTFARILASLYDAMLDESRWPATSALIDEACGLTGNGLMVGEGPKNDVRGLFVGLYYRGQRREDLEREYLKTYHPIDERVPRFRQLPARRLVHITDLYTAEEWRCCTARSKSLTSLCRLQSHPAQYVSGIPSAAILLSISHPIRCSTRCLANVRARISGPMIAL